MKNDRFDLKRAKSNHHHGARTFTASTARHGGGGRQKFSEVSPDTRRPVKFLYPRKMKFLPWGNPPVPGAAYLPAPPRTMTGTTPPKLKPWHTARREPGARHCLLLAHWHLANNFKQTHLGVFLGVSEKNW